MDSISGSDDEDVVDWKSTEVEGGGINDDIRWKFGPTTKA
jgi:hypothetical protein